jgi:hypothetical protein
VDDLEGFRSDETRPRAKKNERARGREGGIDEDVPLATPYNQTLVISEALLNNMAPKLNIGSKKRTVKQRTLGGRIPKETPRKSWIVASMRKLPARPNVVRMGEILKFAA